MNKTFLKSKRSEEVQKRQAQLFGMGMAKTMYGFAFRGYYVDGWSIENMSAEEWQRYLIDIRKQNESLRAELTLSEKEIAQAFVSYLKAIVAPELKEGKIKDTIDGCMYHIQELTEFAEGELESCQQ